MMRRSGRGRFVLPAFLLVSVLSPPARAAEASGVAVELQSAFTRVAEMAVPAVCVITNKQVMRRRSPHQRIPPEFRYFFGIPDEPLQQRDRSAKRVPHPVGAGSGIIIRADGYIVTNHHVIKDNDALEVRLRDGRVFDSARDEDTVEVVGTDEATDLAVLRIGGGKLKDLPALEFADSDGVKVGQWAIAVGAPFSLDYSVTVGVVSQKGRHGMMPNYDVRELRYSYEDYIQTDASINLGNSGGPLLDIHGNVIGVNNFIMTGGGMSRGSIGIGFAIASNLARQVSDSLIEHGTVRRPWLGITMQPLGRHLQEEFGVAQGVLVNEVIKGDPADKAGVKPGDVILKVGDREVRTPHDVQSAVLEFEPGEKIPLLVHRDGKEKVIEVVARLKDDSDGQTTASFGSRGDLLRRIGLALEDTDEGVMVVGVVEGSPADIAPLVRGDIILEVNRQKVKSVSAVVQALAATQRGSAVLYVERRGARQFVPVELPGDDE